jgi:tetratricopeptide (TPR) repeat protein
MAPPTTLHDRYDLIRPLARGGMAMVYLAREVDTGREVALKRLELPEGARLADWRLRFQQEFHTAARLRHPHLVATWDYADGKDGVPFFTMEYLPGPGLEELIPIAPERLTPMLPGLLQALAYLHHQGLVHCDLKPENIRLGADGGIRLMDLGLITRAGQPAPGIQGTFPYLPPEVIRRAPIDRRSDLYALGAVLYHLLAGRPVFEGDPRAVLTGHLDRAPEPLRRLRPEVPEALETLVMRLLAKDPLSRFQSADEVLRFLGEAIDAEDDQTLFHPPLVGRSFELAELDAALGRARSGACEEVWLTGEPDSGLMPLLEEFLCHAQMAGATVIRGGFRPRMAPFEGLRPVVRALVALVRHEAEAIAPLIPVLARVLPELGASSVPDGADLQQEKVRLFEALTRLVRMACAAGPVVLAFSDAEHAESAWREWLEYARRNAPDLPFLVVATFAGEPDLDLDPGRTTLELAALDKAEIHEAARAILGQVELPEDFTNQVHALSGGFPLRLDGLLRRLVDSGHLRRQAGAWVLPEVPIAGVLASLDPEWALEQGLRNLPPLARVMLDALLVRGRESALFELAQIVGQLDGAEAVPEGGELFDALRALEEGGWVAAGEGLCRLAPGRDRETLLARVTEPRRLALHAAIASALEPRLAEAGEDPVLIGELAAHSLAALDARRGPRHALAAAQRRARLFDLEGAEALLGAALSLIETVVELDGPLLLSLHRLRADVARLAGDRRVADQSYQRALALAGELSDPEALSAVANGLGRLRVTTGQLDEAEKLFLSVLARLGDEAPHPQVAQALTQLGRLALTRGDLSEASAWVQRALGLARAIGDRALTRENMAQLGYLYVAGGERAGEGLGLLFEALQMTEKDEAKLELNACYALLGNAQLLLGRFVEAKLAFQRNCDLCAEIGAAPHDEATAFMRRAAVELALGDYRGARKSATPAAALARMVGNKGLVAQVRLLDGLAALYQGDYLIYQDAVAWVEEAIAGDASAYMLAMWHTCRAEAEGHLGQWSQALSSANQALEVVAQGAGHEYRERAQLVKAESLMRLGLNKPARQEIEGMATPLSEALQARLLLAKARLETGDGKPAPARTLAERALGLAQRAGVVPVAAECCLLLARLAPNRDDALSLSRKALLDAEVCGHPALEAEALYQASCSAGRAAQADYFITAAEEAWRRAVGSMNPTLVQPFGGTEERRPLRDALARREAEGYRPGAADHLALLALLSQPPEPSRLLPAVAALCRENAPTARVAVFWEGAGGAPILAYGVGMPHAGAATPMAELEAARAGGDGVVLVPLASAGETPWGAVLVSGASAEEGDRLRKLLPYLTGALWAARRFQPGSAPAIERVVPQAAPAPVEDVPAGWPRAGQ